MARVQLHDIVTEADKAAVLKLERGPGQDRYLGSMDSHFEDAIADAIACPRYWSVHDGDQLVGFVMISDDIPAETLAANDDIVGPYFLWRLLIDAQQQGHGYGAAAVRLLADQVRAEGAAELLVSYVPGEGDPEGFYRRLGFEPTGDLDPSGEVIMRLTLPPA